MDEDNLNILFPSLRNPNHIINEMEYMEEKKIQDVEVDSEEVVSLSI